MSWLKKSPKVPGGPFPPAEGDLPRDELLKLAEKGIKQLLEIQRKAL